MIILKNKDGLYPAAWETATLMKLYKLSQEYGKDIVELEELVCVKLLKLLEIDPWKYKLRMQKAETRYRKKNNVDGEIPKLRLLATDGVLRLGYTAAIMKVEKDLQSDNDKREETL